MLDDSVTGLLSLPERRLAMVYGPVMIGDDRKFSERASENVKIDWDLTSTDIGGGQAVVHPGNSKITLNPDDKDEKITLEFKGNTMKVKTPASYKKIFIFVKCLKNCDEVADRKSVV